MHAFKNAWRGSSWLSGRSSLHLKFIPQVGWGSYRPRNVEYTEDSTRPRVDTNFISNFQLDAQRTSKISSSTRYKILIHNKIKAILAISRRFRAFSSDFLKCSEHCLKLIRTFPIIFRKFLKVAEYFQAIFEDFWTI